MQLATVMSLQLLAVGWCFMSSAANDKIDAIDRGATYVLEVVALALLITAAVVGETTEGEEVDLNRLLLALQLAL